MLKVLWRSLEILRRYPRSNKIWNTECWFTSDEVREYRSENIQYLKERLVFTTLSPKRS